MGDYSNLNDGQRSNNGKSKFFEIFKLKSGNKRRLVGASERPSKCKRVHSEVRFFTLTFYFASLVSVMIFSFFDICDDIQLLWYLWRYSPSLISVMIFAQGTPCRCRAGREGACNRCARSDPVASPRFRLVSSKGLGWVSAANLGWPKKQNNWRVRERN